MALRFSQPEGFFLLKVTTCERENGFFLIEVFRKLFNPQNQGHLETGGLSYKSGFIGIAQIGRF
jgi:hypothetical protein